MGANFRDFTVRYLQAQYFCISLLLPVRCICFSCIVCVLGAWIIWICSLVEWKWTSFVWWVGARPSILFNLFLKHNRWVDELVDKCIAVCVCVCSRMQRCSAGRVGEMWRENNHNKDRCLNKTYSLCSLFYMFRCNVNATSANTTTNKHIFFHAHNLWSAGFVCIRMHNSLVYLLGPSVTYFNDGHCIWHLVRARHTPEYAGHSLFKYGNECVFHYEVPCFGTSATSQSSEYAECWIRW